MRAGIEAALRGFMRVEERLYMVGKRGGEDEVGLLLYGLLSARLMSSQVRKKK